MTGGRQLILLLVFGAALAFPGNARARVSGTKARPYALLLGDSNMFGALGHALQKQLGALGYNARIRGRPGSGLARPDFYDWPKIGKRLVQRYKPEIVIIIFGGNDGQRLRFADGSYKNGVRWKHEAAWSAEYTRRLERLAEALMTGATPELRHVFVLAPTNRRPARARAHMKRIVAIQKKALAHRRDVMWVNTFDLSSDEQGRYLKYGRDWKGKRIKLRRRDGIHLTRHGAYQLSFSLHPVLVPSLLGDRERPRPLSTLALE